MRIEHAVCVLKWQIKLLSSAMLGLTLAGADNARIGRVGEFMNIIIIIFRRAP